MSAAVKEIRALNRGVKVVETLCRRGTCSLAELHHGTGLPKSTLRRILATFKHANFLRCSLADGFYRANIHVPSDVDTATNPSIGRIVAAVTEIRQSGGESEPDIKALAVMPRTLPSTSAAITVTTVAKLPMTRRNSFASTGERSSLIFALQATFRRAAHLAPLVAW